jgi:hypothetical protein
LDSEERIASMALRGIVWVTFRAYGKNDSFGTKAALSQLESFSFWEGLS